MSRNELADELEELVLALSDVAALPGPNAAWPSMLSALADQMRLVARQGILSDRADEVSLARINACVAAVAEVVARKEERA